MPLFGGTAPSVALEVPQGSVPMVVVTGPGGPLGKAIRAAFGRQGCLVAGVGGGPATHAADPEVAARALVEAVGD